MRITRAAQLTVDISPADAQGKGPLPTSISRANISFEVREKGGVVDS